MEKGLVQEYAGLILPLSSLSCTALPARLIDKILAKKKSVPDLCPYSSIVVGLIRKSW